MRFKPGTVAADCALRRVSLEDRAEGEIAIELGADGLVVGVDFVGRRERDGNS